EQQRHNDGKVTGVTQFRRRMVEEIIQTIGEEAPHPCGAEFIGKSFPLPAAGHCLRRLGRFYRFFCLFVRHPDNYFIPSLKSVQIFSMTKRYLSIILPMLSL